jgi:Zn-dependent metalloprotease
MDRQKLNKKSYKDLRLFISKTNICGYTKLSKSQMIDLIMLQHPHRFTPCMKAVQPSFVIDLKNKQTTNPADEFTQDISQNINIHINEKQNKCDENIKVSPFEKLKLNVSKDRPLTDKEIIEQNKLRQGIITFN